MAALAKSGAAPKLAAPREDALFAAARGFGTLVGCAFGYSLVALAVIVTVEAVGRKLVGFSIQGADELGGYILAFGSSLCFSTALVERGHIRIDIFHAMFPRALRIALDWVSIVTMAVFAVMIAWLAWVQLADSIDYGSTAPTPWATPLVYPMSLWVAALAVFALLALAFALHATQLLVGGRVRELEKRYGPKEAEEEIREELADLERR